MFRLCVEEDKRRIYIRWKNMFRLCVEEDKRRMRTE